MKQISQQDDDIVAGHQKMSLKCPVGFSFDFRGDVALTYVAAELHANNNALSLYTMRSFAVFRRNVLVFGHGADDNMAMSSLRESVECGGSHCRRVCPRGASEPTSVLTSDSDILMRY